MANKKIKIQLYHSPAGRCETQRRTVKGLGFTKLNQIKEIVDTVQTRGMVNKVSHLVRIVEGR